MRGEMLSCPLRLRETIRGIRPMVSLRPIQLRCIRLPILLISLVERAPPLSHEGFVVSVAPLGLRLLREYPSSRRFLHPLAHPLSVCVALPDRAAFLDDRGLVQSLVDVIA